MLYTSLAGNGLLIELPELQTAVQWRPNLDSDPMPTDAFGKGCHDPVMLDESSYMCESRGEIGPKPYAHKNKNRVSLVF